jgi:hypothetical protein
MSRYRTARLVIVLGTAFMLAAGNAPAVTIRHDVDDSLYLALAAETKYETAGLVNGGTTCAVAGGVVIHPEWILTAGHCVPGSTSGQTVKFNLGPSQTALEKTVFADNWFRHSSYTSNVADGNDVALIHLEEPLLDVTPIRLYRGVGELGKTTTVVGYGKTGTGLTGDTQARGTRRGGQFIFERFGAAIGANGAIGLGDFDNPNNPGDNVWGSSTPLPLEAAVAFNDSGSPWYIDVNGLTYVAATTSFRTATAGDGNANSDYGDISGGTRVSRQITWIDANHDRTIFWNGVNGDWSSASNWVSAPVPTAVNAVVVDIGQATISAPGAEAKFVFVDGTGTLQVGNTLDVNNIVVKGQGTLSPVGSVALNTNVQMSGGSLEFNLGTGDQFSVTGVVAAAGELGFTEGSYNAPSSRGDADEFTLLVASDLQGSFAAIDYEGSSIDIGTNYVGSNQNGDDGLFRIVSVDENDSNEIVLVNYLAIPGDANGDLVVDGLDFIIWNDHKFTSGNDWSTGDFTGEGVTDGLDFIMWNEFKFTSANIAVGAAPSPVPEPVGITMLWLGLGGLAILRRRFG